MFKLNDYRLSKEEIVNFPNGEIGFNVIKEHTSVIKWRYEGDHELLHLKMLADHLTRGAILQCEYLPYSRMDRVHGNWAFTLKTVCDLINSCNFSTVWVAEPHSDVCMALLDRVKAYYPTNIHFDNVCKDIGFVKGEDYIVFPDAGAEKRYSDWYKGHKIMIGYKTRDFQTGKITEFRLNDTTPGGPPRNPKVIIIDDLCSKGGTFLATGEALRDDYGVTDVTLLVAHLETAVHQGDMLDSDVVKRIYATKSLYNPVDVNALKPHPKIHIYNVSEVRE